MGCLDVTISLIFTELTVLIKTLVDNKFRSEQDVIFNTFSVHFFKFVHSVPYTEVSGPPTPHVTAKTLNISDVAGGRQFVERVDK